MKYVFIGLPTYISDYILSVIANSSSNIDESINIMGGNISTLRGLMDIKEIWKNTDHTVHYFPSLPANVLPAMVNIPPNDFEYRIFSLTYTLHDYILYKTIEMMSKESISVQSINNFILNNDTTIKKWKENHDLSNRTGEFDLSFATKFDIEEFCSNPIVYTSALLNIPLNNVRSALKKEYKDKFDIPFHYYTTLKSVVLSDPTLEHILKI